MPKLLLIAWKQSPVLLAVSGVGWGMIVGLDQSSLVPPLCLSSAEITDASHATRFAVTIEAAMLVLTSWIVMLVAMMPPLLVQPVKLICLRSLTRRRLRSLAFFTVGYGAIWLAAGIVLALAAFGLDHMRGALGLPPLVVALLLALAWQATPAKQTCLNRCHRRPVLSPFGWRADVDCLHYGATHGTWCVGACGAVMLVPLTSSAFHLPLMATVALAVLAERTDVARPARWGAALPGWIGDAARVLWRRNDDAPDPAHQLRTSES